MLLYPKLKKLTETSEEFKFGKKMYLSICEKYINKDTILLLKEIYKNFTCGKGRLLVNLVKKEKKCAVFSKSIEKLTDCIIKNGYKINIGESKVEIYFEDDKNFIYSFFTILQLIEVRNTSCGNECYTLPIGEVEDYASMQFRSIHLCVFPETRYYMLRKFLRLIAFSKYTHVVLEFWGMYKFKCCKALYRKNAFSYNQVKNLAREANALGLEIIPMVNHLGHAAMNRAKYCKHCTLDQKPELAPYFEPGGWTWNILNPDTRILLKKMREELIDVCGSGSYFHIGCDEAHTYGISRLFNGKDKLKILTDYINEISNELKVKNRRAIMWGDQLLFPESDWPKSVRTSAESREDAEFLLDNLDKNIIINDWQYNAEGTVMPSSKKFAQKGFEVIIAGYLTSGDKDKGTSLCVKNVVENNYKGYMQTTWSSMHGDDAGLVLAGANWCWNGEWQMTTHDYECILTANAYFSRNLIPPKGNYKNCGIKETDIEV